MRKASYTTIEEAGLPGRKEIATKTGRGASDGTYAVLLCCASGRAPGMASSRACAQRFRFVIRMRANSQLSATGSDDDAVSVALRRP